MEEIHILNQDDKLLSTITEETGLVSTRVREELNQVASEPFVFTVDADTEEAVHVVEENQVVFRDKDGDLRLYVIKEIDDLDNINGPQSTATCFPAYMIELRENIVVERRFTNQTPQTALNAAVQGSRWRAIVEGSFGTASTHFYYNTSLEAVWNVRNTWGGDIKDVVLFDAQNNITSRQIKLLQRLGADKGKRFEMDHNMDEIQRVILSYPITALYGRGSSLPIEDDEGDLTGGHTRYIGFADVAWSVANGDPVDKPLGQLWVGDPAALAKYGRLNNGQRLHRYEIWQDSNIEDPEELLLASWEQLKKTQEPEVNYRMTAHMLEYYAGYEHEKVSLGDTVRAFDREFARPIEVQARVIAIEYDLLDIEGTAIVEIGQFLSVEDDRLDKIEEQLNNQIGKVRNEANRPITNDRFPDIKPVTPIITNCEGIFEAINIWWTFNSEVYVNVYEVYASQVRGFTPSSEHLIYRGRANGTNHVVGTDQVWYYRVRAINTHGRPSDFSAQAKGSTARILTEDILFGPELAPIMREIHRQADIIGRDGINPENIRQEVYDQIQADAKVYTDQEIQHTENALMQELADRARLEYVEGRFTFIEGDIVTLTNRAEELIERVNENAELLAEQDGKIVSVVSDIDTVKGSLSATIDTINRVEGDINTIENTVVNLTANVEGITTSVSKLRTDFDNIEIGGRNLANRNSIINWNGGVFGEDYIFRITSNNDNRGGVRFVERMLSEQPKVGKRYVLSFKIRKTSGDITFLAGHCVGWTNRVVYRDGKHVSNNWERQELNPYPNDDETYQYHVYMTYEGQPTGSDFYIQPNRSHYSLPYSCEMWDLQFEEGTKPTKWNPAPEDSAQIIRTITETVSRVDQKADSIIQSVTTLENKVDGNISSITSINTELSVMSEAIRGKAEQTEITTINNEITNVRSRVGTLELSSTTFNTRITDLRSDLSSLEASTGNLVNNISLSGNNLDWHGDTLLIEERDFNGLPALVQVSRTSGNVHNRSSWVAVDPSKTYEVTIWMRRDVAGGSGTNDYFGLFSRGDSSSSNSDLQRVNISNGSTNITNNLYFWSGNQPLGEWIKRTAYILPAGTNPNDCIGLGTGVTHLAIMRPETRRIQIRWLNWNNGGITRDAYMAFPKFVDVGNVTEANNRITSAETAIEQNANSIHLRAQEIEIVGNRMTIAEGQISTMAGEIDLKVSRDGVISAINLQPGTVKIETRLLEVTDFQNLVDNGTFENDVVGQRAKGWSSNSSTWSVQTMEILSDDNGSTKAMRIEANVSSDANILQDRLIQVQPGDEFYVEFLYRNTNFSGNGAIGVGFRTYNADGSARGWDIAAESTSKTQNWRKLTGSWVVPNGVAYIAPRLRFGANGETTNRAFFDNIIIRRKNNAQMIVDGTITANHMRANSITAGNGAIANAAITSLNLQQGIIQNVHIEESTIRSAKIHSLSADKINAGTLRAIDIEGVNIVGSVITSTNGSNISTIQGGRLEARGRYSRTWLGQTTTHDTSLRLERGYFRMRNNTLSRSLYLSDFGLSTFNDGEGEGLGSSGSLYWWDTTYSPSNANGITLSSYGGAAALRSELSHVVLDSYQSAQIDSRNSAVFIRPYKDVRPGTNTFAYSIVDSPNGTDTDGLLYYGIEGGGGYRVGLRFTKWSQADPTISVTDGNGTRGGNTTFDVGNLKVNEITKRTSNTSVYWNGTSTGDTQGANTLRASGIRVLDGNSDLFLATSNNGAVRVAGESGYNNGDIAYRRIAASDFVKISSRKYKTNIEPVTASGLAVINSLTVVNYDMIEDIKNGIFDKKIGFISEDSPAVSTENGGAIVLADIVSFNVKATQELSKGLEDVKDSISILDLRGQLNNQRIKQLEEEVKQLREMIA
ncbi:hypothetical protein BTS2_0530 [Bacillus sp. TS-2]|nr:hypothetical protein BTS2_0530 [Bacillus sp. TS-2]